MYSRPSTASGFCLQGLRRTDYGTCRQGLREPVALRHRVMAIFGRALKQVGENGDVSTKLKRIVTGLDSSKEIRNQIFYLLVKIQLEHHFTDQFQLTLIFYFSEFSLIFFVSIFYRSQHTDRSPPLSDLFLSLFVCFFLFFCFFFGVLLKSTVFLLHSL